MPEAPQDKSRPRVEGWKDIAKYFGRSVRAVQDWEGEGLKIYRFQNRVWAYVDDLETFQATNLVGPKATELLEREAEAIHDGAPAVDGQSGFSATERVNAHVRSKPSIRNKAVLALLSAVGVIAALLVYFHRSAPRDPNWFQIEGPLLTVFDDHNRKLWDYVLPGRSDPQRRANTDGLLVKRHKIADVDDDGRKEILVGIADLLYCFHGDGRLAWTYRPGRETMTTHGQVVPGIYHVELVDTLSKPRVGGGRIIVGAYRGPESSYVVELLTKDGRKVSEYYHHGWFFSVAIGALDQSGNEDVFLGGVDDSLAAPLGHKVNLVVLNPDEMQGQASTLSRDERHALSGLPAASEKAVLLLPDFAPNADPHLYCRIAHIVLTKNTLELQVTQGDLEQPRAHFRLDRHLKFQDVWPDLRLRSILDKTVLRNLSPAQAGIAMRAFLGDILYLRDDFDTDGSGTSQ